MLDQTPAFMAAISAFCDGRLTPAAFHDRFFEIWHALSASGFDPPPPRAIEDLFYVVEAYCPDPALRRPDDPTEADEAELRAAAATARAALGG